MQVQLNGTNFLSLAEVKMRPFRTNLAQAGTASQSSTLYGAQASRANDGDTNDVCAGGSLTHTDAQAGASWQVGLGSIRQIDAIEIWNRTDCCGTRLSNFTVSVFDGAGVTAWSSIHPASPNSRVTLPPNVKGKNV